MFPLLPKARRPPTYAVTPAAGSVNEGGSVTFNVATTNVPDSTTLYWTISHGTTADADFSVVSGSFSITGGAGNFSVTAVADSLTEGAQTFQAEVRTGSTAGPVVATSSSVTVNDTSIAPTLSLVNTTTAATGGLASSIVISKPTGVASGDIMYIVIGGISSSTTSTTVTPPSGWTPIDSSLLVSSRQVFYMCCRVAGASEPSTYTFSVSVTRDMVGCCLAFRSTASPAAHDSLTSKFTASGTSIGVTAYTGLDSDCVCLFIANGYSSTAVSCTVNPPSGFLEVLDATVVQTSQTTLEVAYHLNPSSYMSTSGTSSSTALSWYGIYVGGKP